MSVMRLEGEVISDRLSPMSHRTISLHHASNNYGAHEGTKEVLGRARELWDILEVEWVQKAATDRGAATEAQRWKYLAMLHLRVHCNWTYEMIGSVFGHSKGHVAKSIARTMKRLKEIKELSDLYHSTFGEKFDTPDESCYLQKSSPGKLDCESRVPPAVLVPEELA